MRTSTKVLMVLFILSLVGVVLTSTFIFSAITINQQSVEFNFTTMSYIALGFVVFNGIFATILYSRFLKSQKITSTLFFSVVPITIVFALATYFLATINSYNNSTANIVRQALKITTLNYNNYLWIVLLTIIYLIIVFIIFRVVTKPLKKLEQAIERLSDGNVSDKIYLGGGRQFQKMEYDLNKINDNYKKKEIIIKQTTSEAEKYIPKQFIKFLGKKSILELEVGTKVQKEVTTMFCDIRNSTQVSSSLSLEENFNYINSYLNVVSPIIRKYNGFIDKYLGDGVMAVFTRSRQAYDCAHAIIKAIKEKNMSNVSMPNLEVGVSLNTGDVVFGVVGDEVRKSITVISDSVNFTAKIGEVNKIFGSLITFSKATLNDLSSAIAMNYRYVGNLKLDNKEYTSIFESLDAYQRTKREKLIKHKIDFEQGVRAYVNGKFDQAKTIFENVYKKEKDDKVCYVFYNKSVEKLSQ